MNNRVTRKRNRLPFPGWRRLIDSVLLLSMVALLSLIEWRAHPHDDLALAHVQAAGVLVIGMDPSYPPFADGRQGAPIGLDVDIATALAARLGVRVQIRALGYDGLYDALKVGEVDALISALAIDPALYNEVIYTRAYFDAGAVIVSRSGQFAQMADLEGRTIAAEYGTAADETVRLWQRRLHQLEERPYATTAEALDAVYTAQVDAALVDAVSARLYKRAHSDVLFSTFSVAPEPYVAAVRFRSFELAKALNSALDAMAQDGELTRIIAKWL